MNIKLPESVKIVEVGVRDGLQNEKVIIQTAQKVELIHRLVNSGLQYIEAGSFVSPKWVPQMADSADVFRQLERKESVTYAALTPNLKGLEQAIESRVSEVAVFGSASEGFSQKNINCSVADSLTRFEPVVDLAASQGLPVRAYISCVLACPYDGDVKPAAVRDVALKLLDMGCYEVSLGDTTGVGTPGGVNRLLDELLKVIPASKLAVHFHDTYGQALANIYAALQFGIEIIDSSIAGLGGCPYAKVASGNVATEDVVYMLNGLGVAHGINLEALVEASNYITHILRRDSGSKVTRALCAQVD